MAQVSIMQCMQICEHSGDAMAELLCTLKADYDHQQLIGDVLKCVNHLSYSFNDLLGRPQRRSMMPQTRQLSRLVTFWREWLQNTLAR